MGLGLAKTAMGNTGIREWRPKWDKCSANLKASKKALKEFEDELIAREYVKYTEPETDDKLKDLTFSVEFNQESKDYAYDQMQPFVAMKMEGETCSKKAVELKGIEISR